MNEQLPAGKEEDLLKPSQRGYYVYVTEACNLRCNYCFVREKHNQRHLTKEKAGRILEFIVKEATELKRMYVHFFGGEPLIVPEMVDYMAGELRSWSKHLSVQLRLGITTNGILLTEPVCEMLIKHDIGVQLSLDGSRDGNDVHRQIMGGGGDGQRIAGSFEKVLINNYMKYFGKDRPNCRMTLTAQNLGYLSQSIRELCEIGFRSFSIIPNSDEGVWDAESLKRYEEELDRVFQYWAEHREISVNIIEQTIMSLTKRTMRKMMCQVGKTVIGITVDGDIYPCHDFAGRFAGDENHRGLLRIGNVEDGSSLSIPHEFENLALGPDTRSGNGYDCNFCWAKCVCGRGCPYVTLQINPQV